MATAARGAASFFIALGLGVTAVAQPARPDLVVLELRATAAGVRIGRCNAFEVMVRNVGVATAAPTRLRLTVSRPGSLPAVDSKTVPLAELGPGQQRTLAIGGVFVPEPGAWRIEALADAAQGLAESNEGNNARVLDVATVPALCGS